MLPQIYPAKDGTNRLILDLYTGMDGECVYLEIYQAEYILSILQTTINFLVEKKLREGKNK